MHETRSFRHIAGTGERGFDGDGGPATAARLNEPYGVVVDRNGNVYFADRLNRTGPEDRSRRRDLDTGRRRFRQVQRRRRRRGDRRAGGTERAGAERRSNTSVHRRRRRIIVSASSILRSGVIDTFAGTGEGRHDGDGGPATEAGVFGARAVAFAPDGSLYVMERQGSCIRRVRDGIIDDHRRHRRARLCRRRSRRAQRGVQRAEGDGGRTERRHLRRRHRKSRDPHDRCRQPGSSGRSPATARPGPEAMADRRSRPDWRGRTAPSWARMARSISATARTIAFAN